MPDHPQLSTLLAKVRRRLARWYRRFLERVVMKLFLRRPELAIECAFKSTTPPTDRVIDTALCCGLNAIQPSPERVISNYCQGMVLFGVDIEGGLHWQTFPARAVITPQTAHVPKSIGYYQRRGGFTIKHDERFEDVLRACQRDYWTWINDPLIEIYVEMQSMGLAHSIEVYQGEELVGGLWGFEVGSTFAFMSMFHRVDRAGTIAVGALVKRLTDGELAMVDGGSLKPHLALFGAQEIPREQFVEMVVHGLARNEKTTPAQPAVDVVEQSDSALPGRHRAV